MSCLRKKLRQLACATVALATMLLLDSCSSTPSFQGIPRELPNIQLASTSATPHHNMSSEDYPFDSSGRYISSWAEAGERRAGRNSMPSRAESTRGIRVDSRQAAARARATMATAKPKSKSSSSRSQVASRSGSSSKGKSKTVAASSKAKSKTVASKAYSVRKGDTLSAIAQRHGTTVAKLKSANGMSSDKLAIGRNLKIPR